MKRELNPLYASGSTYDQFAQAVKDAPEVRYHNVNFWSGDFFHVGETSKENLFALPLVSTDSDITGAFVLVDFLLSIEGLNYIIYRLRGYIDGHEAKRLFYRKDFSELGHLINMARTDQIGDEKTKASRRKTYIACIRHQGNQRVLLSLLTNYTPRQDSVLCDLIENSGLQSRVSYWTMTDSRTEVFIRSHRTVATEAARVRRFYISAINGRTGLTSLTFRAGIRLSSRKAVMLSRRYGSARHMRDSSLEDVQAHLEAALSDSFFSEFEAVMNAVSESDIRSWLDKAIAEAETGSSKRDRLIEMRSVFYALTVQLSHRTEVESRSADEPYIDVFIDYLYRRADLYRYLTIADRFVDFVFKAIEEMVKE